MRLAVLPLHHREAVLDVNTRTSHIFFDYDSPCMYVCMYVLTFMGYPHTAWRLPPRI